MARAIWKDLATSYTSEVTYAEACAALAAATRMGRLMKGLEVRQAHAAVNELFGDFRTLDVTRSVVRDAGSLAFKHGLRGFDAVHLSTALQLGCRRLVGWDDALAQAALAEGISVLPE